MKPRNVSVVIIAVSMAVVLTTYWSSIPAPQPLIVATFLLMCPGLAIVQYLDLRNVVQEVTLALALSLAVDAIIASICLYGGIWSPHLILTLLLVGSIG